jgi:hypothetical protein
MSEKRVTSREEFLRRTWKASTARSSKRLFVMRPDAGGGGGSPVRGTSLPTKNSSEGRGEHKGGSLSRKRQPRGKVGTHLLMPYFHLKFPRKCPKSMWKSSPVLLSMMLSLWRSPIPITKVATQYPVTTSERERQRERQREREGFKTGTGS